ncbi:MAG: hypothetical protein VKK04_20710 [Synechococcales bacterium]|nr:hypothetical protein [Synechococcales bacterium]
MTTAVNSPTSKSKESLKSKSASKSTAPHPETSDKGIDAPPHSSVEGEARRSPQAHTEAVAVEPTVAAPAEPKRPAIDTIELAARDVRMVLEEQREQSQILTTKLNILFVSNGALLTSLSISRLMVIPSLFSIAEVVGFLVCFTLLVRAFLPRQVAVSPNLEDRKVLERYLALSAEDYQLQMLVNLAETYNANKQRVDDISQTLKYAAYATWSVAVIILAHMIAVYFLG